MVCDCKNNTVTIEKETESIFLSKHIFRSSIVTQKQCSLCKKLFGKPVQKYIKRYSDLVPEISDKLKQDEKWILQIIIAHSINYEIISRDVLANKFASKVEKEGFRPFQEILESLIQVGFIEEFESRTHQLKFRLRDNVKKATYEYFKYIPLEAQTEKAIEFISYSLNQKKNGKMNKILNDQLRLLKTNNALLSGLTEIRPMNSSGYCKYVKLIRLFATWNLIDKEFLTWRELSAKAFCISEFDDIDEVPSKIARAYKDDIQKIIQFSYDKDCTELGLHDSLDVVFFIGNLEVYPPECFKSHPIPPQILTSSEFYKVRSLSSRTHTLILIENLAPFQQLFEDSILEKSDIFAIYYGGNPNRIVQDFMKKLVNEVHFERIYIWGDHDFEGVKIINLLIDLIQRPLDQITLLTPPEDLALISYQNPTIDAIKEWMVGKPKLIQNYCASILSRGEFEQEQYIDSILSDLKKKLN